MPTRRDFLLTGSSVAAVTVAGCAGEATGRGDKLDASDTNGFEELGGTEPIYIGGITASRYCELTYEGEVRKPEEGFEDAGEVDILVVSEPVFRDIWLSGSESDTGYTGLDESFLADPPQDRIESASQFDVSGEFEGSGRMAAGNYRILVVNHGERTVEMSLETDTYAYTRESESVSCDQSASPLDVKYLAVTGRYPYVLTYHIDVNDEDGEDYSLSLDVQSAREEQSFSATQERDVCGVSFVHYDEVEMDPNVGDELRAEISVRKDGEAYETRSLTFTAGEATDRL